LQRRIWPGTMWENCDRDTQQDHADRCDGYVSPRPAATSAKTLMRAYVPIRAVVGTSAPMINMVIVGAYSPEESAENCDNEPNPPHKQSVGPGHRRRQFFFHICARDRTTFG
jgi:hypothetical protein